jgi:large subunit ribosomal protein L14
MKAVTAKITRALQVGSFLRCADNTGATMLQLIAVKGYHGVSRRRAKAGVADVVVVTVKKGDPKLRHELALAVIIRQRKEYRRRTGIRVAFDDNAAVLVNERFEPKGTRIKGPVAREVVERFSAIGKITTMVV